MKKLAFWPLLACCAACQMQQEKQIVILSTNDMHARIDGYAKVAAYVEQERAENPNVLVLSGGDLFSGNPVVDFCPKYGNGFPIVDLMNRVGYKYTAFGNHEFDYGQAALGDRIRQADFQFLCANMAVGDSAGISQPAPSATFEIDGVKICIISAIQVEKSNGRLIPSAHPDKLRGLTFGEPVEALRKMRYLHDSCDVFIALTHTGIDSDKEIAEEMPELDLIVGGHTHTKLDTGVVVNGVLVTQTGNYLKYIGKTTLTLKGGKIVGRRNELVSVAKLRDEDEAIKNLIEKYKDESPMNEVIGEAAQQFDGKDELGNLMTDAVAKVHRTDFAFQNSGGVRIGTIPKGEITLGKVYELDPFNNNIVVIEMKPAEIRSLIKRSYQRSSKRADLIVSGMTYKIFTKDGRADRVEMKMPNGEPLDEKKYYRVGMNDYISSSYTFAHEKAAQPTGKTSEETIVEYIRAEKRLAPQRARTEIVGD